MVAACYYLRGKKELGNGAGIEANKVGKIL